MVNDAMTLLPLYKEKPDKSMGTSSVLFTVIRQQNMFLQMYGFSTDCMTSGVRRWTTLVSYRCEQQKLCSQERDEHAKHILLPDDHEQKHFSARIFLCWEVF